jgi:RNA polymerase sigma-70 factor (family 1)
LAINPIFDSNQPPINPEKTYDEAEILRSVAQGDQAAFARLLQKHANNLYAQALAYTKSTEAARDIVQDIFLKIWDSRTNLERIESFENYLFIMTRNRIISVMRKKLLEPVTDSLEELIEETGPSAEQRLSLKQAEELLEKGIVLLPPQRRAVFLLSRKEGLSYAEIGERLGISPSTVKGHMIQALNSLREHFRRNGHGDGTGTF